MGQLRALYIRQLTLQLRQYKTLACQIIFPIIIISLMGCLQLAINSITPGAGEIVVTRHHPSYPSGYVASSVGLYHQYVTWSNPTVEDKIGSRFENCTGSGLLGASPHQQTSSDCYPFYEKKNNQTAMNSFLTDQLQDVLSSDSKIYNTLGAYEFNTIEYGSATYLKDNPENFDNNNYNHLLNDKEKQNVELDYTFQFDNKSQTSVCLEIGQSFDNCNPILKSFGMHFINNAFMAKIMGLKNTSRPYQFLDMVIQGMPEKSISTGFDIISNLGLIVFPFILLFPLSVLMYSIVLEKQGRQREMMKLMGMKMRNYWTVVLSSNFLIYWIFLIIFFITCAVWQSRFILQTNVITGFIFFFGWSLAIISFSLFLSTLISKTMVALLVGYLIAIFVPLITNTIDDLIISKYSFGSVLLLIQPLPMTHVLGDILSRCSSNRCLGASDIIDSEKYFTGIIFLYIDIVLYFILGLYLDVVLPQPWGVRKKPLFFLEPILKRFRRQPSEFTQETQQLLSDSGVSIESSAESNPDEGQLEMIEDGREDEDVRQERDSVVSNHISPDAAIVINGIYKKFKSSGTVKQAVNGVHLQVRRGQCFGLLGPNGAGKTTLINMLCGMFSPTEGNATVNGYNIVDEIDQVHLSMGLCPQHDILWDDLTCSEHLLFYSRLKSVPRSEEKQHAQRILSMIGLENLRGNSKVKKLSGGMKRRLSIGISLVGNPHVVMFDEPTTGLDPSSRRAIWDIILDAKHDKCLVLTTHSLEEADILSDRIGIMSQGSLRCLGSALHLKNKFGEGFRVSITFDPEHVEESKIAFQNMFPHSQLVTAFSGNCVFEVSKEDQKLSKMVADIESKRESMHIKEWSLTQTTLEDVFLSIIRRDEGDI
eukprot:gb/GECH01005610.1/.p1 GENE.gb/GECH01005610.1/~~gb/GECH01005610.1/.p1  ORF type:complete len:876 (+),score=173.56 gb/GECH01005610.1/:1-2628(+)